MSQISQRRKPILSALYGTDFHGKTAWFCGRITQGCGIPIAHHTEEKPVEKYDDAYAYLDGVEKYLLLPNGYQKLKDGSYGPFKGPGFRSPGIKGQRTVVKLLKSEMEGASPEASQYLSDDLLARQGKIDAAIQTQPAATSSRDSSKCFVAQSALPLIVQCPSCHFPNQIPSYRSTRQDVRLGKRP